MVLVQSRLVPNMKEPETWSSPKRAIILIDDFCVYHGGYDEKIAQQVYGVAVIDFLSEYFVLTTIPTKQMHRPCPPKRNTC